MSFLRPIQWYYDTTLRLIQSGRTVPLNQLKSDSNGRWKVCQTLWVGGKKVLHLWFIYPGSGF